MKKLLLIDGNSIMNRAFYGIMSSKMLMTDDGHYTNALYGFLSILFKNLEDVNPDYIMIAFDSKTGANVRKQKYEGYKKSRHGMPEELAEQMPEIKEILTAMNIKHLELPDAEGDDILGTAAKKFSNDEVTTYILSGDRDLFQLVQDNIIIRIPRTKAGKTETEIYDIEKIREENNLDPEDLIQVKALMGDSSDEIPGAPGVGPKTANTLIQKYKTIEKVYEALENGEDDFKPKVKESLTENKDLVFLSRELGKIDTNVGITDDVEEFKIQDWNKKEVLDLFKKYKFNRFIERFNLTSEGEEISFEAVDISNLFNINENSDLSGVKDRIKENKKIVFDFGYKDSDNEELIIKKEISSIAIYNEKDNSVDYIKNNNDSKFIELIKEIFEDESIEKIGYDFANTSVILSQYEIDMQNFSSDIKISAYNADITAGKYPLESLVSKYLGLEIDEYLKQNGVDLNNQKQITLFDAGDNKVDEDLYRVSFNAYAISKINEKLLAKLKEENELDLYNNIDMPLVEVLSSMQEKGMKCSSKELLNFGIKLKERLEELTSEIYEHAAEEFNINSTQQLGTILFDKLGLPAGKKTKKGYSTDVDTLEGIKFAHPIVACVLEYRTLMKLNSTYVEGLIPYINPKDKRIHSFFHQTITATGRISSTEPNLQNIPARDELGRNIKKAFFAEDGYTFIDGDYSQIELRVLAHVANDEKMINAFMNDEDIHREVASQVFNVPFDEVTKEQRSEAKAVNFGIVYGITGFGLAKQIGTTRKQADEYKNSYLEKFSGVKNFMDIITEKAKEEGYVATEFGRRRYIPELTSSNFMVREFGKRVAMNTPIQGTAADIMKIAMNNTYKKLKESGLDARIVLQVHDELMVEVRDDQKEKAKEILLNCMENAYKLKVPLKVEISEGKTWFDTK